MSIDDFSFDNCETSKKGIKITTEGKPDVFLTYALKGKHVDNVPAGTEIILHVRDYLYFIDDKGKIIDSEYEEI